MHNFDKTSSTVEIPIIDVEALISRVDGSLSQEQKDVSEQIASALREFGFFYICGHGVESSLQSDLLNGFRRFFAEDIEVKNRISMSRAGLAWRGYFPPGGELTSGRPDRKEGIYFGRELGPDHPDVRAGLPLHGANQWPAEDEHAAIKPLVLTYMDRLSQLGHVLLGGVAIGLGLERDYFRTRFTDEPTILFRAFNYAKHVWSESEDEWGVREYTDYGFLTILLQDSSGGLEVKSRTGGWIEAPPIDGTFVINIGDCLEVWTHGICRATPHRVRNKGGGDRISLPFFFDPNWRSTLEPIARERLSASDLAAVERERVDRWDGLDLTSLSRRMTYGDFLWSKVKKVFPDLG